MSTVFIFNFISIAIIFLIVYWFFIARKSAKKSCDSKNNANQINQQAPAKPKPCCQKKKAE